MTNEELKEENKSLRKQLDDLKKLGKMIVSITHESRGIDGWHLNGDIATWDEFEEFEELEQTCW